VATTESVGDGVDGAASGRPVAVAPYDHDVAVARRKILVVEDEPTIVAPLTAALEREGFEPHVAGTVADAIETAGKLDPDLVLLDLMLPDGSGFDVCRELRKRSEVPVIMLTARGDEADRVVGLELGADDYVVKPFSAREVIARVRAVLRRTEARPAGAPAGAMEIDGLRLDPERRSVELDGEPVDLSRREYDLLERLMRDAGSVITREALIEDVWDMNWFGSTKTLDVHISSLRRKLGDSANTPRFVHTVRGVGFRFSAPGEA
jgi:two-component system, OmpR family, response regulator RegX3